MTFGRSRVALGLYGLLGGAIALACALWLSVIWAGVVFAVLGILGWRQAGEVPRPLRMTGSGQWEQYHQGQWQGVTLEVSRLGPLLCEVRIDRRRYALWYDSLPPEQFRRLRRSLLSLSTSGKANGGSQG
ncbi:hypothetical protein B9H00_04310 [Kushneria marisflavi]|uniref:Uncharacterized protein n=1 Tax=Kushneria marisflavi TaxID=157779 RepID=A0A240UMX7_9GAMM|nr:hypothetical protein B9H00_04310 [Kushneria marisflavi]